MPDYYTTISSSSGLSARRTDAVFAASRLGYRPSQLQSLGQDKNSLMNGKGQEILALLHLEISGFFSYYVLTKLGKECIMIVT